MKHICFNISILCLLIFSNHTSFAQKKGVKDTAKYLQNSIIAHKETFKHQELNTLLKELNLTVKSYQISLGRKPKDPFRSIILYFENVATTSNKIDRLLNIPFLCISFETYVSQGKALGLYSKTFGEWGDDEKAFYGPLIVKDIKGYTLPPIEGKAIKDTIYYLVDTAHTPAKDRMLTLSIDSHSDQRFYTINCPCLEDHHKPVFRYNNSQSITLSKHDVSKLNFISLTYLIDLVSKNDTPSFSEKYVIYFVIASKDQFTRRRVFFLGGHTNVVE